MAVRHQRSYYHYNKRQSAALSGSDLMPVQDYESDARCHATLSDLKTFFTDGVGGSTPVATTNTQGKAKVDHDSAGDPIALTSSGHGSAADPHSQYALDTEKGQANGIATLDAGGKVPAGQLASGTPDGTLFLRDDRTWAAAGGATATATTAAQGKVKVDHDSAGDPVALTSAGHGAAADPHSQYRLESATIGTADLANDAVTYAKIQNVSATDKVLGRSTVGAGDVEEIACSAAGRALIDDADATAQRTTLGLGALATKATVATADIDNDAVTYAKIQNVTDARLLGRSAGSAGDAQEITVGSGLSLAAGSLTATGGGADPWTILKLASDFTTSSASAVDVTGLGFTPSANTNYMIEGILFLRTASAAVNPRVGFAWPTGMVDGVMSIDEAQTATTQLMARGNIGAALLIAVGGLPNATQSWPAFVYGAAVVNASPSGNLRVQLASETAGTNVTVKAGSFLRYRTY